MTDVVGLVVTSKGWIEMDDKKYCSYCKYSNFDTGYFPPRFTCTLYKERIKKDEQARTCPDYKPLEKVEKR